MIWKTAFPLPTIFALSTAAFRCEIPEREVDWNVMLECFSQESNSDGDAENLRKTQFLTRFCTFRCNQNLPQSALGRKSPLRVMKDLHSHKPEMFKKKHTAARDVTRKFFDQCPDWKRESCQTISDSYC